MLICSSNFLNCLQLKSFDAKSIDAGNICLSCIYARVSWFGVVCAENIYTRNAYVNDASINIASIVDTCVKRSYIDGTYISRTFAKDACTENASTESILIKNTYTTGICTKKNLYQGCICLYREQLCQKCQ